MSLAWVRRNAVGWSLPRTPESLTAVLTDLEFVQADPIRAPARAQDLILRQRVRGYRAGDLDRHYPSLDIDEDMLYAYGFVARRLRPYLHPRRDRWTGDEFYTPAGMALEVLDFVREKGVVHPRDVQARFGHQQATNDWGGTSSATTMVLEQLRSHSLIRVADRMGGVRRYEAATPLGEPLDRADRLRGVVLRVARTLAPVNESTLSTAVGRLVWWLREPGGLRGGMPVIRELLARGELDAMTVDGARYVWPADLVPVDTAPAARVRFLAPFDPVVWDRKRFGQIWGWDYRFEAYTPPAKRVRGYYAMPMLWRDQVIGWATCADGAGDVEVGFVNARPKGATFQKALDAEIDRLKASLVET